MSNNGNAPRKSMEERLRESLNREGPAPAEPAPAPEAASPKAPVPVRRVPPPARTAPPPTPVAAAPAPVTPKIVPRSPSAARPAPRAEEDDIVPPSVKGAKPAGKAPSGGPKPLVGARSPQETGMLQMVPLSNNEDEKEAGADPSATAFFAIPAPKAERPKSVAPPPSTPSGGGPPGGPPPSRPAYGSGPPSYSPQPIAGPSPSAPQPLVSGPVVSYGGAAGGTPFQVAGPTPTGNSNSESRVQSVRIFAILLAVFALACVAVLSLVLMYFMVPMGQEKKEEPVAVVEKVAPKKREDTGQAKVAKAEPAPAPKQPRSTTPKQPSAPAAPRLGANASVTVNFSGATLPTSVTISCNGGFIDKRALSNGSATIPGVPTGDTCQMHPKGTVATSAPVRGGQTLNCQIIGTTSSCK